MTLRIAGLGSLCLLAACPVVAQRAEDKEETGSPDDSACEESTWFGDADGDGFGLASSAFTSCDAPSGHVADGTDCDDARDDVYPGASETCDNVDQDCDGTPDNDATDATVWYADSDTDGFGSGASGTLASCSPPDGYVATDDDCNDADVSVAPGALERCDGIDEDCDGTPDNDAVDGTPWYEDADGDGHGTPTVWVDACESPIGFSADDLDCNDADADVLPGADEHCDGIDEDCDGNIDESPVDPTTWYFDVDGDGFGTDALVFVGCEALSGYVADATDCDDADGSVFPLAPDGCDGIDADCDGAVDEDDSFDAGVWYLDTDGDGYGGTTTTTACAVPAGAFAEALDCDDSDAGMYPNAPELCNGLDDDCDSETDEEAIDPLIWYADHDADGYGTDDETALGCDPPVGYVELATDCDDASASFSPGATETCSGLDEDCDGLVDADDPDMTGLAVWYLDEDGDGHGVPSTTLAACVQPAGYALDADDCDDLDERVFPGADETCDATDEDCDGDIDETAIDAVVWYGDADADGYGKAGEPLTQCEQPAGYVENLGDCDDEDAGISPDDVEACDGVDQDCDGAVDEQAWYADSDGDGYGNPDALDTTCVMPSGFVADWGDCDDSKADVSPDGIEVCDGATAESGTDEDCNGFADDADASVMGKHPWYIDADSDNWGSGTPTMACVAPVGTVATDGDCDDTDDTISPDGTEVCGGADEDCDTFVDDADPDVSGIQEWYLDADGDGFGSSTTIEACAEPSGYAGTDDDCDDSTGDISPAGAEICDDGTDQDCDGSDLPCPFGDYTTDWGSEMIAISAGSFTMGGGAGDPDSSYTDHVVTLTHDFWIGQTEITRGQWEASPENAGWTYASMPTYPCTTSTTTADCPADSMTWYDVAKYANALSAQEGLTGCYLADGTDVAEAYRTDPYACPGYRMPTEAEWEYAARASQNTEFSGSNIAGNVAWYKTNAYSLGTYAHEVATLAPNAWGVYDMSGNMSEWANDWYSGSYDGYSDGTAQADPSGPTTGSGRVLRGGNWSADPFYARVAHRYNYGPNYANDSFGARLARSIP